MKDLTDGLRTLDTTEEGTVRLHECFHLLGKSEWKFSESYWFSFINSCRNAVGFHLNVHRGKTPSKGATVA